MTVEVKVLTAPLDYSYGYIDNVHGCFIVPPGHTPFEVVGAADPPTGGRKAAKTGSHWLVLFNAHSEQEINLTNAYAAGKRTLTWGTPFDNAVISMTKGGSPHNSSALLRDWYLEKVRKFGTFICIPPKSDLRFWSGYASPQSANYKGLDGARSDILKEMRPGGGMQWRMHGLPKGTIALTVGLFTIDSGKTAQKEDKKIDVQARLAECVEAYNEKPVGGVKLPGDLSKVRTIGNNWDDKAIAKNYMDMSMSKFVDFDPETDEHKKPVKK